MLAKPIAITSPSRVKGAPEVGRKLVARVGSLKPTDAKPTYAWFRDGQRIARTTKPTYTVRRADLDGNTGENETARRRKPAAGRSSITLRRC